MTREYNQKRKIIEAVQKNHHRIRLLEFKNKKEYKNKYIINI